MTVEKRITTIFIIAATSFVLFYSTINWFGWYWLSQKGISSSSYYFLNIPYNQWTLWAEQTRFVHLYLCIIFSVIIGIFYLCGRFSLKTYFKYNICYFLGQVVIVYILMGIFDPSGITGGLHYLCGIPYRYYRWGFILLLGGVGFIVNKFRKNNNKPKLFAAMRKKWLRDV